jgi:hypothetical protein
MCVASEKEVSAAYDECEKDPSTSHEVTAQRLVTHDFEQTKVKHKSLV